jgi:potassium-dependent mechanosensitive channel
MMTTRHTTGLDGRWWVAICGSIIALLAACFVVAGAQAQTNQTQSKQPAAVNTPAQAPAATSAAERSGSQGASRRNGARNQRPIRDEILFPSALKTAVRQQRAEIDRLSKSIERVHSNDKELEGLRPDIERIAQASQRSEDALKPLVAAVERQIETLGDKPKDGQPSETPEIAAERALLNQVLAQLEGAVKQASLTQVRARQLLSRIHSLRLANLSKRLANPASAKHWQQLYSDLPRFWQQVTTVADNWWAIAKDRLYWLTLILVGSVALWWGLHRGVDRQITKWLAEPLVESPAANMKRVRMALWLLPFLLAPGLLTIGVGYFALSAAGLLNNQIDSLALSALKVLALYLLIRAMAKVILLPRESSWRLIGLPTDKARRYLLMTLLLAGIYSLDLWLASVISGLQMPLSISMVETLLANLTFAALLFAFVCLPVSGHDPSDVAEGRAERISSQLLERALVWLRLPAVIAVIGILAATLFGYLALGRFIAGQVMLFGVAGTALLLGHLAARALARQSDVIESDSSGTRSTSQRLFGQRRGFFLQAASLLLNTLMVTAVVSMLLLSWGYSAGEQLGWARSLLFGFEIGTFRFSLIQIVLALLLFGGVILLTRLFQAWLSRDVLKPERIDHGIANSIHAGIGYAGIALAALVGVSYAGFDLSNIALIASALSIGIGFGLNAIASNFVSGLIMLIERPIKVGDWVVVGSHQGYVRHISVRATEIETFDRASVIIPNSDFMTSAVQNWTHRNAMGRVVVNIGASYSSDPDHVIEVLKNVASECDALIKYPAPSVHFEEFGASSLDFSIRGHVADVNTMLSAKTALRLGIAKAFKEANLEIPFPQQDVHLRDLDGVREMVGNALAQRAMQAGTSSGPPKTTGRQTSTARPASPGGNGNGHSDDHGEAD